MVNLGASVSEAIGGAGAPHLDAAPIGALSNAPQLVGCRRGREDVIALARHQRRGLLIDWDSGLDLFHRQTAVVR